MGTRKAHKAVKVSSVRISPPSGAWPGLTYSVVAISLLQLVRVEEFLLFPAMMRRCVHTTAPSGMRCSKVTLASWGGWSGWHYRTWGCGIIALQRRWLAQVFLHGLGLSVHIGGVGFRLATVLLDLVWLGDAAMCFFHTYVYIFRRLWPPK